MTAIALAKLPAQVLSNMLGEILESPLAKDVALLVRKVKLPVAA